MPDFGTIDDIPAEGLSSAILDQIASTSVENVGDLPIPHSDDGDVKFVISESEYFIYSQTANTWDSIGDNLTDAYIKFLRKDKNLSDLIDAAVARQNLGVSGGSSNSVLISSTSVDLTEESPNTIVFINSNNDIVCRLPEISNSLNTRFTIENNTEYNVIVSSISEGILVKTESEFTLESGVYDTFTFNDNWV